MNTDSDKARQQGTKATPVSDEAISTMWPEFTDTVRARLRVGAQAYGDGSFELPAEKLVDEIEQELDDVMGWGFILWCRLRRLKEALARAEANAAAAVPCVASGKEVNLGGEEASAGATEPNGAPALAQKRYYP